ncbi:hypothetical protein K435DRAFT_599138, partial [Dendrothele bispora CBS 962.96]
NADEVFGTADCLISQEAPFVHVANFSSLPVTIQKGNVLGYLMDPNSQLDKPSQLSPDQLAKVTQYASLVKTLISSQPLQTPATRAIQSHSNVSSKAQRNLHGKDDVAATPLLEGGPKTGEVSIEEVSTDRLLSEVSISSDLSEDQKEQLEKVILRNAVAFGLDRQLGSYDEKVDIELKPGSQPVSLPPFPASPANREVI